MANEILSYEEVLALLSQQARDGSVTAAAALERALRARGDTQDDVRQAIDRILERGQEQSH
jgi:predicted kinase